MESPLLKIDIMSKVVYRSGENLIVWRFGKTSNGKIAPPSLKGVVQTYTFSIKQWELVHSGKEFTMADFFSLDGSNCLDCPFSMGNGGGGCYTHKFGQYRGFKSMLRSIWSVPTLTEEMRAEIVSMCEGSYVRYGSYGEPSLIEAGLVRETAEAANTWTGYTHQHAKDWAQEYSQWFMASVHSAEESHEKAVEGWRSFAAVETSAGDKSLVGCPASNEGGFKSNCAACGLCSGTSGKGKKSVEILVH